MQHSLKIFEWKTLLTLKAKMDFLMHSYKEKFTYILR